MSSRANANGDDEGDDAVNNNLQVDQDDDDQDYDDDDEDNDDDDDGDDDDDDGEDGYDELEIDVESLQTGTGIFALLQRYLTR